MKFAAFEHLFEERKTNFKRINSSPVGGFARGDTYMFALIDSIHLPKSVGYVSTTLTEVVLSYTSKALSLYSDSTEKFMLEVLRRENTKLSFGIWIFMRREMKYQIMYRTTLKNLLPLDNSELARMIITTQREYSHFGRQLKKILSDPKIERRTCMAMSNYRKTLISALVDTYQGVKRSDTEVDICCKVVISPHAPNQQGRFKGFVTLFADSFALQLFVDVSVLMDAHGDMRVSKCEKVDKYCEDIERCLNSDSQEGCSIMYSRERQKFVSRAERRFTTERKDLAAEDFKNLLNICVKYGYRRTVLLNLQSQVACNITTRVLQTSAVLSGVTFLQLALGTNRSPYYRSLKKIVNHWRNSQYFTIPDNSKSCGFEVANDTLFDTNHPLGLHFQCLVNELQLKSMTEELITTDSDKDTVSKNYDCGISEINFAQESIANLANVLLPKHKLFPEKFRWTESRGEFYEREKNKRERVQVTTTIGGSINLWSATKLLFPIIISSMQPDHITPRLIGFAYRSNRMEAIELFYQILQNTKDMKSNPLVFLLELAGKLNILHMRNIYHLMLCPANIGLTLEHEPILSNIKVCALTLPSLESVSDDSQLYFLAPEVFWLMGKLQKGKRPKICHYQHINGAADVYSFAAVMHWLLVPQQSEKPQDRRTLKTEVVKKKRRPLIPADFEEREPLLTDLMHRCWGPRRLRPDMQEVVRTLQDASACFPLNSGTYQLPH